MSPRSWAAVAPSSITTTMAGWTCSSSAAVSRRRSARLQQPPLPQQSRRHIHRRHRESWIARCWLGQRRLRGRLQQRRIRRSVRHLLRPKPPIPQQRRRDFHRCNRQGRPAVSQNPFRLGLHLSSITTATACSICLSPTMLDVDFATPAQTIIISAQLSITKALPTNCGPAGLPAPAQFLYRNNGDGTFTDVSEGVGVGAIHGSYRLDRRQPSTSTKMDGRTFSSRAIPPRA